LTLPKIISRGETITVTADRTRHSSLLTPDMGRAHGRLQTFIFLENNDFPLGRITVDRPKSWSKWCVSLSQSFPPRRAATALFLGQRMNVLVGRRYSCVGQCEQVTSSRAVDQVGRY
jgi:hypothetical protein